MQTKAKTTSRPSILRLLALLKPKHWKYLAGLIGRVALSSTERLIIAYFVKVFVDSTIVGNEPLFNATLINMIAFYLGYVLVAPFIFYLWRSAIIEGTANIRESVFKHLQRLPLGYHELHHTGDALSILTNDVSAAERAYTDDLYTLAESSVQGLTAAIYMLLLNWQLALVVFLSGVAPLAVNALFAGSLRKIGQGVQARLGTQSERMSDLLQGFYVIRAFNLGDWILERFGVANQDVLSTSMKRVRLEAALSSANDFSGMFNLGSILFGAYLVLMGQTTFGILIALVQLSNNINYFVFTLSGVISRIQGSLAAADRILALLDEDPEPESYPALPHIAPKPAAGMRRRSTTLNPSTPMIEFKDVLFGYASDPNILNSLSFNVGRGEIAGFAGPSGGGKSTIFKLLLGSYPIRQGEIFVSGSPVSDFSLSNLRDLIAYVPQDAYLFAGSIYENIRYGKPNATQAQIEAAARAAFAHDFILEFPQGYQTMLGERGARISGGQRQRIAIARALLKDAPILLLDEATSALDSESEQAVQRALEVLMNGRTTLMIAHRFSTIRGAQKIYVVEGGRVVEQGSHAELLALGGVYAGLYDLQFKQENSGRLAPDGSVTGGTGVAAQPV